MPPLTRKTGLKRSSTRAEARSLAASVARSIMRERGIDPLNPAVTANMALDTLDDEARRSPHDCVGRWYLGASENQLRLFGREWRAHQERLAR